MKHKGEMLVSRVGSKRSIAEKIEAHFPPHQTYVEPFFGAGGMFFNKQYRAKWNILNDADDDIYNLFTVLRTRPHALQEALNEIVPHQGLYRQWVRERRMEDGTTDPLQKAVRFLYLSALGKYGRIGTMAVPAQNKLINAIHRIVPVSERFKGCTFTQGDFRACIRSISLRGKKETCFIYADPPYQGVSGYKNRFGQDDFTDLLDALQGTGSPFAVSEFDKPWVLEQAEKRGLRVVDIALRANIKNWKKEILIMNY